MSKSSLRILAALLVAAIVAVLFAGLDSLPRDIKSQISTERTAYTNAQAQLDRSRSEIDRERSQEPALFAAIPSAQTYNSRLANGQSMLMAAGRDIDDLTRLEKRNRRSERDQATKLLEHERKVRADATAEVEAVSKDASQWIYRKQHLAQVPTDIELDYKTVQSADLSGLNAAVQKAETDWPEKKS